jgi:hypothetical protein
METKNQTDIYFSFCLFSEAHWKVFAPFVAVIIVNDVGMDFLEGSNVNSCIVNGLRSLSARRSTPSIWGSILVWQAALLSLR